MGNVRATIEANNRKFEQAFHQADAAGVAGLYTENAYILPPGSEMMQSPGKYVVVWKQQGSDWKVDVDIWNS